MVRTCRGSFARPCRRTAEPGEWYCADCLRARIYEAFRPDRPQGGERHAGTPRPVDPHAVLQAATA